MDDSTDFHELVFSLF
jgi:small subunit ribosomal protein S17e